MTEFEEIDRGEFYRATTKQWERDAQAVFDRLMEEPFTGTLGELARECEISHARLLVVLKRVRDPEWIDDHHWTVPYEVRGAASNEWRITDTLGAVDAAHMRWSQNRRAEEMLRTTRKNIAQSQLALAGISDGRTSSARHWRHVLVALQATEAHLEALVESDGRID